MFFSLIGYSQSPSRHTNGVVFGLESAAPATPKESQFYYNTIDKKYYFYDGTSWSEMGGQSPLTFTLPISVTNDVVSMTQAGLAQNGWMSSADFTTFNNKVSFPGFTSLLADYSFTDNSTNWDLAFGWGDHALESYESTTARTNLPAGSYTTDSDQTGMSIDMTIGTVITLDDANVNVGDYFNFYNNTGGDITWQFGAGDTAIEGVLANLPDKTHGYARLVAADSWTVIVGGTGDYLPLNMNTKDVSTYTTIQADAGYLLKVLTGNITLDNTGISSGFSQVIFNTSGVDINLTTANPIEGNNNAIPDGYFATYVYDGTTWFVSTTVTGGGSGDVIKVGTPIDNQFAVWTGDGTLEGVSEIIMTATDVIDFPNDDFKLKGLQQIWASSSNVNMIFNDFYTQFNVDLVPNVSNTISIGDVASEFAKGYFLDAVTGRVNQTTVAPTTHEFLTKGYADVTYAGGAESDPIWVAEESNVARLDANSQVFTGLEMDFSGGANISVLTINKNTAFNANIAIYDINNIQSNIKTVVDGIELLSNIDTGNGTWQHNKSIAQIDAGNIKTIPTTEWSLSKFMQESGLSVSGGINIVGSQFQGHSLLRAPTLTTLTTNTTITPISTVEWQNYNNINICDSATDITMTLEQNTGFLSVAYQQHFIQKGVGNVIFTAGTGVTILTSGTTPKTLDVGSTVTVLWISATEVLITGRLD